MRPNGRLAKSVVVVAAAPASGTDEHEHGRGDRLRLTSIAANGKAAGVTVSNAVSRPRPFDDGWRLFYTAQRGDRITWEILAAKDTPG